MENHDNQKSLIQTKKGATLNHSKKKETYNLKHSKKSLLDRITNSFAKEDINNINLNEISGSTTERGSDL